METESTLDTATVPVTPQDAPQEAPQDAGDGEVYVFPASFAQQRLWFLDRLEPDSPAYNLYNAVRLVGDLRVDVLARTMEEIVARHETLRTTFATLQGEPVQVISPVAEVRMPLLDLAGLPAGRRDEELAALSTAEARRPFDLARGPLLRVTLVRLAGSEHAVLFNLHHIVGDGWSMGVLVREVAALYTAFAQGEPSPLPDLPLQYADFAQAQREWLQGEVLAEQIAYWRRQLAGLAPLDIPADHPRPVVRSARSGVRGTLVPAGAAAPLADLARRRGTTLFVALLAAVQTLLHRYTGGDDVAVGTVTAGRSHVDSEGMIGFFVNTLVMRTDLSGEPSFGDLLDRAHSAAMGAFAHQDLPFERLVEELQPQRDLSRSPFFDVLLVLQNLPPRAFELPGLRLLPAPGGGGTALFDWTLAAIETDGGLVLSLAYSADLFEAPTAERALAHLAVLVEEAGAASRTALSGLPLLSPAERAQLVREWNDTAVARPGGLFLHGLVADQAAQAPDAVAVTFEEESLTWSELQLQAGRLARRLRALGCGPEVRVGVAMERSPELVVALLGTLAAGAAYVPLDPDHPRERLALMIEDAGPAVIVAQERLLPRLPESQIPVLLLDGPLAPDSEPPGAVDGATRCSDQQLAYVIFTSGSTGRPKASMLHHRGIVNRLLWMREAYGVGPSDAVLQKTPFGFDVSVWELFVPLITGARLVMARPGGHRESSYQVELVGREGVSVLHFVPSMLRVFLDEPDLSPCGSVRLVVASGEALSPDLARRFRERLSGPALENLYGPTEASVEVTAWSCVEDLAAVPIGRPIANADIHLVDRGWQPVPIGVPGELWIAGVPVARGYLGRPDLTAERFVPNPFSPAPGARAYRSGDLARHRADGAVEFLGRADQQVKIRGFRVEPGEVEAALLGHPAVGQAAVVARSGAGGASLVAYVSPRAGAASQPEPSVLRDFLRRSLPEPMVPARFVRLAALPLNASGKLDRRALPEVASEGGKATVEPVPPRDPVEEGILAIWRDVLGIDRLGVHDVFFELGGHSLSATRVVSRVRAAFGIDLPLRSLFEAPTVAGLGERVRAALRHDAGVVAPPLVADPAETGRAPLSFAQQRLWFLHRLEPESTVYNLRTGIRLPEDLDPAVLARSLGEVVRRHATLRTRFAEVDGEPVQVIEPAAPPAAFVLPMADLVGQGAGARAEAQRLAEELGNRPFDLALEPPVRWLALRLPGASGGAPGFALLAVMHHVVSDAWSMGILARELSALYAAFRRGLPSPLPPLPVQYADFARWQRRWLAGDVLAGELAWWRERLAGLPARLDLPADRPRPPVQSQRGAIRELWIAPELGARVAALGLREGATPFMVLLTTYQGLLARWSGQDDFAVGTPIAGRTRVEVEELIGFFINNLVLLASLGGEPGFREVLGQVRSATLDAYAHQDLPFEKLVEELAPERSLAHSPIFQVVFGLQTAPTGAPETPDATGAPEAAGAAGDSPLELASRTAKYDLLLSLFHEGEGFAGLAEYSTDLFDATTVDRFLEHFQTLLAAVLEDPGRRLADIPLLTGAERHQTLVEWSGPVTSYPREATVQALLEEQADLRPDAVAVVSLAGGRVTVLTYGELEARANRLAHHLRAWGVGPEVLVGLCLERSADLLVGILGILKAGGAYVPLDPSYPLERLAWLLDNTFMPVVVAEERTADLLPAGPLTRLVLLDGDAEVLRAESDARPDSAVLPDNLVYVLYTSGSTGEPKGVAAVHRGVIRLVRETRYARFGPGEAFLQLAPVSFDASTLEIWGPLLNGGLLVVPAPGTVSLAELGALLADHGVTTLWLTAGLFHEMADAHLAGLAPVRQLLAGGDVLSPVHAVRVLREMPGLRLINGYGPTENTTFTCCHPMADPADVGRSVAIGRPIANTSVHLLDRRGLPVPLGVHGELAAGGDGLARGYLDRPDLTAERWRPDAASGLAGGRLYHTGDLARLLPDGRIEFLGRIDQQVKIRGFRIEPGEIEAALARHPAVRESVVVAREDRPGDRRLVAYVVAEPEGGGEEGAGGERELRSYLAERLPGHMVPAYVVFLEALPLTANGKVDRRALPAPGSEGGAAAGFVAPAGEVEEELAAIWSEVLARSPIGAQDNFFELGGHSLLAVRVISQVRDRFGVELPLRTLFEEPTVAGMARSLREAGSRGTAAATEAPPPRALLRNLRPGHEEVFPLSFAQQRLWFLDRLEPGSPLYNMPLVLRLEGGLEVDVLERALARIVERHESLRTTFRMGAGGSEPVQVVAPARGFTLPVIDLAAAGAALPGEVQRLVMEEALRPFDLERGPLFRPRLLRLGAEDHVMLASMHHIVSDGWSLSVLVRELVTLYGAFRDGAPSPLPELPVQYADYAVWQRGWLSGEVLEAELDWWRQRLAGLPPLLDLPTDRPRPPVQTYAGTSRPVRLEAGPAAALSGLALGAGATLFMAVLALFQSLLSRWAGQEDFALGSPVAGRNRSELEGLVGFFVNTLVLRADLADRPGFHQLLERTRQRTLEVYAHQEVPFEKLVEELRPQRSLAHPPLFQVVFALQNMPRGGFELPGLRLTSMGWGENRTAKFDLTLFLTETEDGLAGTLEYNTDLFDAATVDRMGGHLQRLAAAALAAPEAPVAELSFLSAEEKAQLLVEWNATRRDYPRDRLLSELFIEQAARRPDAVALVAGSAGSAGDERITYGALELRAARLARRLQELGVGPDVPVALFAERSLSTITGLLAISLAGGAYVPLDPRHPAERLAFLLEDVRPAAVLTEAGLVDRLPAMTAHRVPLDGSGEDGGSPLRNSAAAPGSLACVLYTSGSTGRPKGVAVTHRNVARLVRGGGFADLGPDQVFLQLAPLAFDASTLEVWGALANGGQLVIPAAAPVSLQSLAETLELHGVTTLWLTAGLFHQMVDEHPEGLRPVRQLLAGGDVLSPPHVRRALAALPESVLINGYGPTENTTFTCCHVLRRGESLEPSVAIGRPIGNTRVHLLDEAMAPVPAGVRGELFAGGDGVARGYFGQPALTAERFVPDPFDAVGGGRLYRTGDLARWRPDGTLEFLGRIDQQVKLRGFRVEPGEVEAVLAEHPAVRQAAVLVRRDDGAGVAGEKRLVGYVAGRVKAPELRRYLERLLPSYMVPAGLVVVEELSLNASGKVDRLALSRLAAELAAETADAGLFVAPRGPLEEMVAAVWSEVLGRERIGARDDFFALGGHSLLATRVISRVRSVFGVDLPVASLFEAPTPEGLAARIAAALSDGEGAGAGATALPIVPVPREGRPPLSFAQERLWFLDQLEPGLATYNMPFSARLTGAFDLPALAAGLAEVVRRHEALRTTFPAFEGWPWQRVAPFSPPPLPAVDLRGLPRERRAAETRAWLAREATRPFDLARGPLLRPMAFLTADDELVLFLALHHTVSDGWSMGILEAELGALYAAFSRRLPSSLPELPVQYVDFAVWQRRWLTGEVLERQLGYWRRTLAGTPALLELPADRPRPPVQSFRGATLPFALPAELARGLRALARRHGATLFMTVLAAFQAFLHRATGQDVIPVGTPVANRHHQEIEGLIGFFVNTLVLPADLGDDPPFTELLTRVRQTSLAAHSHQDLPFEKLVEELAPERSLGHSPLFQVMLTFQNLPFQGPDAVPAGSLAGLAASGVETSLGIAKFDLDLALVETEGGLDGSLTYAADLFDEATAVRLLQQLETLLSAVTDRPEVHSSELLLLSAAHCQQVLEWSGREAAAPVRCLHRFVEEQAERTPEAVAVRFGDDLLTYGALEGQANRLAHLLRRQGVGPEVPVAVFMDRSLEMVVALLGVLKAGGAYVPLDPVYPRERLAFMLEDCQAPVLLSQDWLVERLPEESSSRRITLDPSFELLEDEADERPEFPVALANLAYVIYTSGSTGRPKGVAITHGSAAALLEWAAGTFGEDELAGTLASTSICFDLSVFELFVPLSRGGCVLLVESALDLLEIGGEVGGQPVTLINTVPSAAAELVRAAGLPASVHTVNLAGEPIPPALAAQLHAQPGVRRLLNLYGPSEDTTYSTMETVLPQLSPTAAPPAIGRPLAGTRAYVLDAALQPVPPGMPGELYLGGAGLARGYFRRPDLTAERFVPDLFATPAEGAGRRLYRTGDRVRHLADGRLDFLGRIDHQVKLRGYRMELGEIEAALSLHPGVRQAVAGVRESGRDRRLVAWFVPTAPASEGTAPGIQELRAFLAERLPHYMVPSALVALAALPLTPTGKIDRRALPDPGMDAGLAPRDVTELELARLWEEVLGVGQVGVRDDFFLLGGHSLLAVRLMALVRERFGRDLPLASLFRAPTIEQLALLLRQEGESGDRQALVEITPPQPLPAGDAGAAARPFFCVHPAGGNVLCYLDLARALGPGQPFYGLQLPTTPALRSVEEMAAHYLAAIRAVQPAGPYLLGGWSIGGIVAFEMAQQLTAAGEAVALLAVIDSILAIYGDDSVESDELVLLSLFAQDLAFTYGREFAVSLSVAELRSLDPAHRLQRVFAAAQESHLLPPGIGPAEAEHLFAMYRTTRKAMAAYVPRPYPGPVVSFFAAEGADREGEREGSSAGWENVAEGGVEVETIAGDHYSILRPPMVAEVAARLAARIQALGGSEPR